MAHAHQRLAEHGRLLDHVLGGEVEELFEVLLAETRPPFAEAA
jgi:hypothetical protein